MKRIYKFIMFLGVIFAVGIFALFDVTIKPKAASYPDAIEIYEIPSDLSALDMDAIYWYKGQSKNELTKGDYFKVQKEIKERVITSSGTLSQSDLPIIITQGTTIKFRSNYSVGSGENSGTIYNAESGTTAFPALLDAAVVRFYYNDKTNFRIKTSNTSNYVVSEETENYDWNYENLIFTFKKDDIGIIDTFSTGDRIDTRIVEINTIEFVYSLQILGHQEILEYKTYYINSNPRKPYAEEITEINEQSLAYYYIEGQTSFMNPMVFVNNDVLFFVYNNYDLDGDAHWDLLLYSFKEGFLFEGENLFGDYLFEVGWYTLECVNMVEYTNIQKVDELPINEILISIYENNCEMYFNSIFLESPKQVEKEIIIHIGDYAFSFTLAEALKWEQMSDIVIDGKPLLGLMYLDKEMTTAIDFGQFWQKLDYWIQNNIYEKDLEFWVKKEIVINYYVGNNLLYSQLVYGKEEYWPIIDITDLNSEITGYFLDKQLTNRISEITDLDLTNSDTITIYLKLDVLPIYTGPTTIVKNKSSIITATDIMRYISSSFTGTLPLTCKISNDEFTGNGATVGKYNLTIEVVDGNGLNLHQALFIEVEDYIPFDLVIGNNYYIANDKTIDETTIKSFLKNRQLLPDVDLTCNIISDYFTNHEKQGSYNCAIDYSSTAGYNGSLTINIVVYNSFTGNVVDEAPVPWWYTIVAIILVVLAIVVIYILIKQLFGKKNNYSRKWKRQRR